MLDVGAGTGLLSLMIVQKNEVLIDAVEIETDAAEQAKENAGESPFSEKISVVNEDVLTFSGSGYDVIVCNPPFYENELQSPVEGRNIAHHSQKLTWKELFPVVKKKLAPGGDAYFLLPAAKEKLAEDLLHASGLYINEQVNVAQVEGRKPFRIMIRCSEKPGKKTKDISIRSSDNNYTKEFIELLSPYYLNL
jgi:tRNA1Val (adenine37-N6)-methyltransferase